MKNAKILILAGIMAAGLPALASAEGYWVDSSGSIVKNGSAGCWHAINWASPMAVEGCDPVAKKEEKPQPKMATVMPPPPMPAPEPAKVLPQKVTFSAAALFDFDKSALKPDGKAKLDNFAHDLNGVKYDAVHVTGYTDRIGSAKHNEKLSLSRANEVKTYLASKGIPADRITAEGKGKAQPITKPGDCKSMTKAKTIAYLQPDRRTEVVVDGTK